MKGWFASIEAAAAKAVGPHRYLLERCPDLPCLAQQLALTGLVRRHQFPFGGLLLAIRGMWRAGAGLDAVDFPGKPAKSLAQALPRVRLSAHCDSAP